METFRPLKANVFQIMGPKVMWEMQYFVTLAS